MILEKYYLMVTKLLVKNFLDNSFLNHIVFYKIYRFQCFALQAIKYKLLIFDIDFF